ncbi:transposase [Planomonospora venezuelensis]|uniref:transposase n=1 Tax=Planomonospora venezuelensis TaxID=1999 RepID=UPI00361DBEFB
MSDGLWQRIEPLLPTVERRYRNPGRKRIDDRKALCGILFVLYTAIPWEFLPQELGFGSGMTCWRRLRDWRHAGVWTRLHELLVAELPGADRLDWSKTVIDGSRVRATEGGAATGPRPVGRGETGAERQVITGGGGLPRSRRWRPRRPPRSLRGPAAGITCRRRLGCRSRSAGSPGPTPAPPPRPGKKGTAVGRRGLPWEEGGCRETTEGPVRRPGPLLGAGWPRGLDPLGRDRQIRAAYLYSSPFGPTILPDHTLAAFL